jgi:excinuclease ABC subunit C
VFRNARGRVIYVGKAQNLKSRVRSYFRGGGDGRVQIPQMVERAVDLDVVVTPSAKDALLLENELIKRHKPPFNVRFRDDKQYLGLRLDAREPWPRPTPVRRFKEDGAAYFGPYTSSQSLRDAISNLRRIFPLRSCSDPVFRDYARRGRPCIEYEMKRCLGPCCDLIDAGSYAQLVEGTVLFLRGRSDELLRELTATMERAAADERYEEAARLRDRIGAVEQTVQRQQIVGERAIDRDVFGWARRGGEVEVAVLHVRAGRVVGHVSHAFSDIQIDDAEAFGSFLGQYYAVPDRVVPGEVLVAIEPADAEPLREVLGERAGRRVALRAPQRGPLRELVGMANANAELQLAQRLDARESVLATLAELQQRLGLARLPRRIECYDVSTLGGTLAVASRVAFEDGQPDRNGYRRYRIRAAAAGDDFACLREVLSRRLERREIDPLPDLLMVDGGKGQLGVAVAALRDAGVLLDAVGISKERDGVGDAKRVKRHGGLKAEQLHLAARKDALMLAPSSAALLLLQRIRDEAHRFAIEFQRNLRQRVHLTSILEEIGGIGPSKRRSLLRELGSLRAVREATALQLAGVEGVSSADAQRIRSFFAALEATETVAVPDSGELPGG